MTNSPFACPTRTAPMGPWNGMSDTLSATEAPLMPATSGSFVVSAESTMAMTCVSQRKPSGNSGRIGRSIWRLVRISRSLGTSFALDESARDASRGVGVLAVVNREREKVDALAGIGVGAGGGENHVFANAHDAGAVCLLGQLAGFKANGLTAVQLNCYFVILASFIFLPWKTQPMKVPGPLRCPDCESVLLFGEMERTARQDRCGSGIEGLEIMSAERGWNLSAAGAPSRLSV